MKKSDFILKLIVLQTILDNPNTSYEHEWVRDLVELDGYKISISAWDADEDFMIDQHITGLFPELETNLGIEELQEGDMYYSGDRDIDDLTHVLNRMGFTAIHDEPLNHTPRLPSLDELEKQMIEAVNREDYEEAAKLRDLIQKFSQ